MKKLSAHFVLIAAFVCIPGFSVYAQSYEEDQARLKETMDLLISRLTYSYYNPKTDEYWNNRLFYNAKDKSITIKNVSTDKPNSTKRNKILDHTVQITHLNSASITVENIDESKGRRVQGKEIKIRTIGDKREIQRSFNGRSSLKEAILDISIPKHYEDSIGHLANSLKEYFATAIDLASRVYVAEHVTDNVNTILDIFHGSFEGSNGAIRTYNTILHNAFEGDEAINKSLVEKEIIGYDEEDQTFFRWAIHEHDASEIKLSLVSSNNITLQSPDGSYKLIIIGINDFAIEKNGNRVDYHRVSFE